MEEGGAGAGEHSRAAPERRGREGAEPPKGGRGRREKEAATLSFFVLYISLTKEKRKKGQEQPEKGKRNGLDSTAEKLQQTRILSLASRSGGGGGLLCCATLQQLWEESLFRGLSIPS